MRMANKEIKKISYPLPTMLPSFRDSKYFSRLDIKCSGCFNYIDDIIVIGKDKSEHDKKLSFVLKTLKGNNVL